MLYPSAGNNNIKGITFIKTVYKLKKGEIEVYIDEEYHKYMILQFRMNCILKLVMKL